jgi:subtilisin family serine protease
MRLKQFLLAMLFVLGTLLPFSAQAIELNFSTQSISIAPLGITTHRDQRKPTLPNPFSSPKQTRGKNGGNNQTSPSNPFNNPFTQPPQPPQPSPATSPISTPSPMPSMAVEGGAKEECHVPNRTEQSPDDELYCLQWNLRKYPGINVEEAWKITRGEGIYYVIIDTGVGYGDDKEKENGADFDLSSFKPGKDYVQDVEILNPWDSVDQSGHGTANAGTIIQATNNKRQTSGISYKSYIHPVRVNLELESEEDKTDEHILNQENQIADAIRFGSDKKAHVFNLSIQSPNRCNPAIQQAAAAAYKKGAILVASVGNSVGQQITHPVFQDTYYHPFDKTTKECTNEIVHGLIVAASNEANNKNGKAIIADYSNLEGTNILAPGGLIGKDIKTSEGCTTISSKPNEIKKVAEFGIIQSLDSKRVKICQGTSQAAPHASGGAGLSASVLISGGINPNSHVFPDLVIAIIEATAHIAQMDQAQFAKFSGNVREGYEYTPVIFGTPNPLDAGKAVKLAQEVVKKFGSDPSSFSSDRTTKEIEDMVEQVLKDNLAKIARYSKANFPAQNVVEKPTLKASLNENGLNMFQILWEVLSVIIFPLGILGVFCYPFWMTRFAFGILLGFLIGVGIMSRSIYVLPILTGLSILLFLAFFPLVTLKVLDSQKNVTITYFKQKPMLSILLGTPLGIAICLIWISFIIYLPIEADLLLDRLLAVSTAALILIYAKKHIFRVRFLDSLLTYGTALALGCCVFLSINRLILLLGKSDVLDNSLSVIAIFVFVKYAWEPCRELVKDIHEIMEGLVAFVREVIDEIFR